MKKVLYYRYIVDSIPSIFGGEAVLQEFYKTHLRFVDDIAKGKMSISPTLFDKGGSLAFRVVKIKDKLQGIIEIEWSSWKAGKTGISLSSSLKNLKEFLRNNLFTKARSEEVLKSIKEILGKNVSRDNIARVRIRFTPEEVFAKNGKLLDKPHIHIEVLMENNVQMNYHVALENVVESDMRTLFNGKDKTYNLFEDTKSEELVNLLFQ